jgi:hypothetical protein
LLRHCFCNQFADPGSGEKGSEHNAVREHITMILVGSLAQEVALTTVGGSLRMAFGLSRNESRKSQQKLKQLETVPSSGT